MSTEERLELEGFEIEQTKTLVGTGSIVFTVKRVHNDLVTCPYCQADNLVQNGTRNSKLRDLSMAGKITVLIWKRQRYICRKCSKSSLEQSPLIHDQHSMTIRLLEYIGRSCRYYTFAYIADQLFLDEKTIRNAFYTWCENQSRQQGATISPEILGIEEVFVLNRPHPLITNVEDLTVIDLLWINDESTVAARLASFLDKKNIRVILFGMNKHHYAAARRIAPWADVAIDRKHVDDVLEYCVDWVRLAYQETLSPKQRRRVQKDSALLSIHPELMTPDQVDILERWTAQFPRIGEAYKVRQGFEAFYHMTSEVDARLFYTHWQNELSDEMRSIFSPLLKIFELWGECIFSYFRYPRPVVEYNAGVEKIQAFLKYNSRGYSFNALRAQVLFPNREIPDCGNAGSLCPSSKFIGIPLSSFDGAGITDFSTP